MVLYFEHLTTSALFNVTYMYMNALSVAQTSLSPTTLLALIQVLNKEVFHFWYFAMNNIDTNDYVMLAPTWVPDILSVIYLYVVCIGAIRTTSGILGVIFHIFLNCFNTFCEHSNVFELFKAIYHSI